MILEQSLDQIAGKDNIIEADCNQIASVASNYIERGFVGIKQYDYAGVASLNLFRNDTLRGEVFPSVALSKEDITAKAQMGVTTISGNLVIAAETVENIAKLPFHLLNETRDGGCYALTRYFRTKGENKKNNMVYAVFERVSTSTLERFVTPKPKELPRDGDERQVVAG